MHNTQGFNYLSLRAPSGEALFSADADYLGSLEVIARLSRSQLPIAAYCLLSHEMHLLVLGNEAQGLQLAESLMEALTGSANHPLTRLWEIEALNRDQIPQQLCNIHLLPCQQGLFSTPDIHRWNSHFAYNNPEQAPGWLQTEPVWLCLTPRFSNRVRAYLHRLDLAQHKRTRQPKTINVNSRIDPIGALQDISARDIADCVLFDHQMQWQHLTHGRIARRKSRLAGICYAIALQLDSSVCDSAEFLSLFHISQEELLDASRMASIESGQYIVATAARLRQHPTKSITIDTSRDNVTKHVKNQVSADTVTTAANATALLNNNVDVDLDLDMSYLDLDEDTLGLQAIEDQPSLGLKPLSTQ